MPHRSTDHGFKAAISKQIKDRWIFCGLLLLIVLLPLPRGSNRIWALSLFELGVFALSILWLFLYVRGALHAPKTLQRALPILLFWLAWLLWIALQLLPLPIALVASISPTTAEAYRASANFLGTQPDFIPLSLYPHETRAHWLESASYFCLFTLVLATIVNNARLRVAAMTIVFSGLFQALYGSLFLLSGATHGLFMDSANPLGAATGTFINRNHFAGYLEITSAVGIGLVLAGLGQAKLPDWRARFRHLIDVLLSPTIRLRIFLAIMVIGLILSRSRGGNIAFFSSLAVAGLLYVLLRERRLFFKSLLIIGSLFLIDLWLLGSWVGVDQVVERLENTQIDIEARAVVWPGLVEASKYFWLTGSGLVSFASVFPAYRPEGVAYFNDHAHNDYMEFLIETGVPGIVLLGMIVAYVVVHALRVLLRRRDRLACGMAFASLMSLLALAIHGATDFNLQIPANAATLVIVMALTVSCSPQSRRKRTRSESTNIEDEAPRSAHSS